MSERNTRCAFCTAPATTRIYLRDEPSEGDLFCCTSHRRDALDLAELYQDWLRIAVLRRYVTGGLLSEQEVDTATASLRAMERYLRLVLAAQK